MAKRKGTEGQETQWPKKRTEGQATQWPKKGTKGQASCLSFCSFSFDHFVACPSVLSFWTWCCLSFCHFLLAIVLLVLLSLFFGHCVVCPSVHFTLQKKMTEGQATQWPQEQGQKNKQQSDQRKRKEGQGTQWPKEQGQKDKQQNVPFL
jgi:hypothetical protein